jgi:N-succinyldiaminopimelate aminotransferase
VKFERFDVKSANSVLSNYGTTVFEVMSRLAIEHGSINLGQGFPDGNGPDDVRAAAHEALDSSPNQYPPMMGVPELRQAVTAHNKRFYDIDSDWQTETIVTSGATEALAAALFGLIEPGDEVVLIEPLYDSYMPIIQRAGGIPRLVRVEPPHWTLPRKELAAAFSNKTKLLLLNNPQNPTGKVFDDDELAFIADLVCGFDAYAICDEVYEHLVFDGLKHSPLMNQPGMRERCIKIGSAGKTFSLTGWKVGYAIASPALMAPIAKAHQFLTFTTPPNLQKGTAYGLGKDDSYFDGLAGDLQAKRDLIRGGLERIGFTAMDCSGTYFLNADFSNLGFIGSDEDFCRMITVEAGVTAVPVSAFYSGPGIDTVARFCFCKEDEILEEAIARLEKHFCG